MDNTYSLPQVITDAVKNDLCGLMNHNDALGSLRQSTPTAKVLYSANPESDAQVGDFVLSTGEHSKFLSATLLAMSRRRVMYGEYDRNSSDNAPLCSSSNCDAPDGGTDPCTNVCEEKDRFGNRKVVCPHAKWQNGKRPECSEVFSTLLWDWQSGQVIRFDFKGTSVKHLNKYYNQISNVRKWGYPEDNIPVNCCVRFELHSKAVNNWFECLAPMQDNQGKALWEKLSKEEVAALLNEVGDCITQFQRLKTPKTATPNTNEQPITI